MELRLILYPYAVVVADNGDILAGKVGEELKPIPIPVNYFEEKNLSDASVREMTYRIDEQTEKVSLPLDQFNAALEKALPETGDHKHAASMVHTILTGWFSKAVCEAHAKAEKAVEDLEWASVPSLLAVIGSRMEWHDGVLTLDKAVDYIMAHTSTLDGSDVRDLLRTKYRKYFTAKCDEEEIAECNEGDEDGTDAD